MKITTKIIFYLLFIPYIFLIIFGVISSFCGISIGFFGDQSLSYGPDAFAAVIIFSLMGNWYIFVFCLIIQIALLVREKIKNKGTIKRCVLSMMDVYILLTLLGYGLSFWAA